MREVQFSREDFETSKPKLGRSLSVSVLAVCLTAIAIAFGESFAIAISILIIGLGLSWITYPMHYFIGKGMKSGRFSFQGESNVLPPHG